MKLSCHKLRIAMSILFSRAHVRTDPRYPRTCCEKQVICRANVLLMTPSRKIIVSIACVDDQEYAESLGKLGQNKEAQGKHKVFFADFTDHRREVGMQFPAVIRGGDSTLLQTRVILLLIEHLYYIEPYLKV